MAEGVDPPKKREVGFVSECKFKNSLNLSCLQNNHLRAEQKEGSLKVLNYRRDNCLSPGLSNKREF